MLNELFHKTYYYYASDGINSKIVFFDYLINIYIYVLYYNKKD